MARADAEVRVLGLTDMRTNEMARPFAELGSRARLLAVDSDRGLGAYADAYRSGVRRLSRWDAGAVLAYNGSGLLGAVGALLSARCGVPFLIRQNGDVLRQHREQLEAFARRGEWLSFARFVRFALLTRAVYRYADGVVPVSEALTDVAREQTGCPRSRVRVVQNPIRADEFFESTAASESDAEGGQLLTVTNLDFRGKYRGAVDLLEALAPVLRDRPDLRYTIAGDGQYLGRLRDAVDDRIDDPGVRERIELPGFVEGVADLYAAADVFVYASYIDAYPNVVLEAQAAGLPVVTSPTSGIVEQVDHGESGYLIDPSDTALFARRVTELLDDPTERECLGRNARRRVRSENDPAVVGRRLYAAVRSIARDGRAARSPSARARDDRVAPVERTDSRIGDSE